jgi:hypothetical protein
MAHHGNGYGGNGESYHGGVNGSMANGNQYQLAISSAMAGHRS